MQVFGFIHAFIISQVVYLSSAQGGAAGGGAAAGNGNPAPEGGSDLDQALYDRYKNQVCKLVPAFSGADTEAEGQGVWSDVMNEDEVLELAFVNMAYSLTTDSISYLRNELGWKKSVMDTISLITKATCRDDVISESFLNAAKNLFLYYMVKQQRASPSENVTEGRMQEWKEILESLTMCADNVEPIGIVTDCGMATTFVGKDESSYPIMITNERMDDEHMESIASNGVMGIDTIIDTVWWMFSTAYARCYSYFYPNEDIILLFFQMFREDFLDDFLSRWRSVGTLAAHFPIIFGPYDFDTSAGNVRKCSAAAYQYESIAERQLVRPVTVLVNNKVVRNYKTADVIDGPV